MSDSHCNKIEFMIFRTPTLLGKQNLRIHLEICANRAYIICKGKSKTELFRWKFSSPAEIVSQKHPKALCAKKISFTVFLVWENNSINEIVFLNSSNNTRDDSTNGHHQMVNTKIRLIIFFAVKDGESLYSQQKQGWELTVAQIMNSLLPNSDWNWRK